MRRRAAPGPNPSPIPSTTPTLALSLTATQALTLALSLLLPDPNPHQECRAYREEIEAEIEALRRILQPYPYLHPPLTPNPNPTLAPSLPLTPYASHQALQRTALELRAQLANANAAAKATLTLGPSGVALPG